MKIKIALLALAAFTIAGCNKDDSSEDTTTNDNFDRSELLSNWADNIIIPAYNNYASDLTAMREDLHNFTKNPTTSTLNECRQSWASAYRSWQWVEMFEIGKAEELSLRNFSNIYPTNSDEIDENIQSGNYNLSLPSNFDAQGLPAIDYLINGIALDDAGTVDAYNNTTEGTARGIYLRRISTRLDSLTQLVVNDWNGSYRNEFVNNDGNDASSAVNKLVNDYLFYYEKVLRAGKIGIPAGVFSGNTLADKTEGFYDGEISKQLFLDALDATQDFFNGKHFGKESSGESMASYLDFLNTIKEGQDLKGLINNQFESSRTKAESLKDNLTAQVSDNNNLMLETYDELQKNVVLLKVDMLQALNIKVDFIDADGD